MKSFKEYHQLDEKMPKFISKGVDKAKKGAGNFAKKAGKAIKSGAMKLLKKGGAALKKKVNDIAAKNQAQQDRDREKRAQQISALKDKARVGVDKIRQQTAKAVDKLKQGSGQTKAT